MCILKVTQERKYCEYYNISLETLKLKLHLTTRATHFYIKLLL